MIQINERQLIVDDNDLVFKVKAQHYMNYNKYISIYYFNGYLYITSSLDFCGCSDYECDNHKCSPPLIFKVEDTLSLFNILYYYLKYVKMYDGMSVSCPGIFELFDSGEILNKLYGIAKDNFMITVVEIHKLLLGSTIEEDGKYGIPEGLYEYDEDEYDDKILQGSKYLYNSFFKLPQVIDSVIDKIDKGSLNMLPIELIKLIVNYYI